MRLVDKDGKEGDDYLEALYANRENLSSEGQEAFDQTFTTTMSVEAAVLGGTYGAVRYGPAIATFVSTNANRIKNFVSRTFNSVKNLFSNVKNTVSPNNLLGRQLKNEMTGNRIKKMTKAMKEGTFDWNASGPVQIAEKDGVKIIIDGHHRVAAAKNAGITDIPVKIVKVTKEQWDKLYDDVIEATGK
jgi:prophage DNA circulation protein